MGQQPGGCLAAGQDSPSHTDTPVSEIAVINIAENNGVGKSN